MIPLFRKVAESKAKALASCEQGAREAADMRRAIDENKAAQARVMRALVEKRAPELKTANG